MMPETGKWPADEIAEQAAQNTLALNPLLGIRTEYLRASASQVLGTIARRPKPLLE